MRLYGRRLWPSLAIGIPTAVWASLPRLLHETPLFVATPLFGALLLAASYVGAVRIAAGRAIAVPRAFVAAALVFVPFQFLLVFVVLPALVLFAAVGLAVPVLALERVPFARSFGRAWALARADFVHALGSLAALAIVVAVTQGVMAFVLRDFGDQTLAAAFFIALVVVSPLFFLGSALLYFDQEARHNARRAVPHG